MKKASLCVALCAALSLVAAGADAQGKKDAGKSKKAKVTVQKKAPEPVSVSNFHACVASGVGIFPVITTVGCTVFWAIPIGVESLFFPHRA
jgi:hypothetical protein